MTETIIPRPQVRVVTVGHVDHGKSTLIGRLLHGTGNLMDGKLEELQAISERRGVQFEWSFVLDALQSERDHAITIDTTRIWLRTPAREIVLIDAPGHKEFLRNMVTGASDADAALLVVDANEGVSEQTRRHAFLLELLGVGVVVVAINKMDSVDYSQERYNAVRTDLKALLERINIRVEQFVPISAREGENVCEKSDKMSWYDGPWVLKALQELDVDADVTDADLRIAIQGVVRQDLRRIFTGRIASGTIRVGDEVVALPTRQHAKVATIESWPAVDTPKLSAAAGESIGFTLDQPVFVDRGDVVSKATHAPELATAFKARLLWLGSGTLRPGSHFRIRVGTRSASVEVASIERDINLESLLAGNRRSARTNDIAEVTIRTRDALPLDTVGDHPDLGRFILQDGMDIVAGGTIVEVVEHANRDIIPASHLLDSHRRALRNGHRGAILWLTGLPGAGKSTIAMELERRLFEAGRYPYVLDGDNVRGGLSRDLGFSDGDRRENVRRVGEVAALFADAGLIAIAALISPHRSDRDALREAYGSVFHEIFISADASVCESRDPKGHYQRARMGSLTDFTGINGEYEMPNDPELVIDTSVLTIQESVAAVLRYITEATALDGLRRELAVSGSRS